MTESRNRGTHDDRASARPTAPSFRSLLEAQTGFATVVELVPWAGEMNDELGRRPLGMAADLAGDPRITALSVTDNAGGHARLSPGAPAEAILALGHDVVIHVACRDRNRNGLLSLGWDLLSRGLTNVLAITGDYPVSRYQGLPRPVFDIDSVDLLAMYRAVGGSGANGDPGFFLGAAVANNKRYEREVVPQYLKLEMKIRNGAAFVISQLGYDSRKQDELLRYMARRGIRVPAVANAYILGRGVARAFHAGRIPGCFVSDELLAIVEREAGSPDRGRAFFLELAAKQVAIARGLGYRGIYLSGQRDAGEIATVLDQATAFGTDDWRDFAREIRFGQPGGFCYFESDAQTGLNSDRLDRRYAASLAPRARRHSRRRVPLAYRLDRLTHDLAFRPGGAGFRLGAAAYERVERLHAGKPLHVLEQAVKTPLFDCRDCGDCSLPDIAYLCPESRCAKNQRNGPCGGSHDGLCEVPGQPCIWALAYARLKPYGEELTMLERPPVMQDNALRRTSAWANTYLGRDHAGRDPDV
jgi:methylenetetrahydrofolate reductase (NADPH)